MQNASVMSHVTSDKLHYSMYGDTTVKLQRTAYNKIWE